MVKLSVCMIVKNEQDYLPQCLRHLKPFVDEIIIIDTGSTDKSVKIAKENGAIVYEKKWNYDFSAARNESLKHATGDWILVVDADEIISGMDMKKIRAIISDEMPGKPDAYFLDQINYTNTNTSIGWKPCDNYASLGGDAAGYFISPLIRLFRNNKGYEFRYKIHETLIDSVKQKKGVIAMIKIPIHHYGQVRDYERLQKKLEMYTKIIEDQTSLYPNDPKVHYQMGIKLLTDGQTEQAIQQFRKTIELKPDFAMPHIHIGDIYNAENKQSNAIKEYAVAIEKSPKNDVAYIKLAALLTQNAKFDDALRIIAIAQKNGLKSPALYCNLGFILMRFGKYNEAIKVFEGGLDRIKSSGDPYYPKIINYIVDCYLGMNKKNAAVELLKKIVSKDFPGVEKFKKRLMEIEEIEGQVKLH